MPKLNGSAKFFPEDFEQQDRRCLLFLLKLMFKVNFSPTLLAVLGGCLFGLAIVLAADPVRAYGWAALAAYIGLQLAAPLARSLYNNPQEEGGAL